MYQLTPPPPELYTVNEYIVAAQTWHNLRFFAYFLHHIEPRLNGRVSNFLLREGLDRYDPYKGAEFLTYAHHAIGNALIQCRTMEESGEDVTRDDSWDYTAILWNGTQAKRFVPLLRSRLIGSSGFWRNATLSA